MVSLFIAYLFRPVITRKNTNPCFFSQYMNSSLPLVVILSICANSISELTLFSYLNYAPNRGKLYFIGFFFKGAILEQKSELILAHITSTKCGHREPIMNLDGHYYTGVCLKSILKTSGLKYSPMFCL